MADTILVPHDGSTHAQAALEYALETFSDARIVLFHAIDPFAVVPDAEDQLPPLSDEWHDEQQAAAAALFEDARDAVDEGESALETATSVGNPPQAIIAYSEDTDIDQIVMGNRGQRGVDGLRLGSTANLVVERAPVPVTVVR
ncbi:universal stress protein [Natronorubrum sp. JWXQ-INN-674]|uniref:Universal stress protein n=1 Tax=Natronorubrum halalkaliphilum TaxID=2691917 RepID=A0A6B0VTE2_9EURY|nr:universal stress protein [Natronorubrum halalkaliphilum]MXV64062.1 universal stress protein [Natronorubrum halalkaliphilum]